MLGACWSLHPLIPDCLNEPVSLFPPSRARFCSSELQIRPHLTTRLFRHFAPDFIFTGCATVWSARCKSGTR